MPNKHSEEINYRYRYRYRNRNRRVQEPPACCCLLWIPRPLPLVLVGGSSTAVMIKRICNFIFAMSFATWTLLSESMSMYHKYTELAHPPINLRASPVALALCAQFNPPILRQCRDRFSSIPASFVHCFNSRPTCEDISGWQTLP